MIQYVSVLGNHHHSKSVADVVTHFLFLWWERFRSSVLATFKQQHSIYDWLWWPPPPEVSSGVSSRETHHMLMIYQRICKLCGGYLQDVLSLGRLTLTRQADWEFNEVCGSCHGPGRPQYDVSSLSWELCIPRNRFILGALTQCCLSVQRAPVFMADSNFPAQQKLPNGSGRGESPLLESPPVRVIAWMEWQARCHVEL